MDLSYFSGVFDSLYALVIALVTSDYFAFFAVFLLLVFLINCFMGLFT